LVREKSRPLFLNFELLEDVMGLPSSDREELIKRATLLRIGPLVEYLYHDYKGSIRSLEKWFGYEGVASLNEALNAGNISRIAATSSMNARAVEFFKGVQSDGEATGRKWFTFCRRLEDASKRAGLREQFSKALAGTFEEMAVNAMEHSRMAETTIVGYRWRPQEFEYVVADAGVGVLSSLKGSQDYDWLEDSGDALETAVEDGQSRFGKGKGRGTGFHDLIYNIAGRGSYLRFRSGDHSLVIDGTQTPMQRKTLPCEPMNGFLISVVCRVAKN
jgi:hypothetical protein